jgi:hypothetical protein
MTNSVGTNRVNMRSEQVGIRIPHVLMRKIDELVKEALKRGVEGTSRSEVLCAALGRYFGVEPPRPEVLCEGPEPCESCGKNPREPPSKLCSNCIAYRSHTG